MCCGQGIPLSPAVGLNDPFSTRSVYSLCLLHRPFSLHVISTGILIVEVKVSQPLELFFVAVTAEASRICPSKLT